MPGSPAWNKPSPVHNASVRRHLFGYLEGINLDQLAKAFQRMADRA
jgi:hypothetical protein